MISKRHPLKGTPPGYHKAGFLIAFPAMPQAAMGSADTTPLRSRPFTATRPGLNRDVPPGKESLMWVANSATPICGERDAVLVDTFLTVEQSSGLAAAIVATATTLKAIYVTHAHGDHVFWDKSLAGPIPRREGIGDV
jgi:Metallo-beta-lactamase superfamily